MGPSRPEFRAGSAGIPRERAGAAGARAPGGEGVLGAGGRVRVAAAGGGGGRGFEKDGPGSGAVRRADGEGDTVRAGGAYAIVRAGAGGEEARGAEVCGGDDLPVREIV